MMKETEKGTNKCKSISVFRIMFTNNNVFVDQNNEKC